MSKVDRPKTLTFIGPRDADGAPTEWFGAVPGKMEPIPASDLDEEATAALSEAQWKAIESDQGKRLYAEGKGKSSTANQPSGTTASAGN